MSRVRRTAWTVFLLVLAVECAIAVYVRTPRAFDLLAGQVTGRNLVAVAGLVWLPFLVVVAVRVASLAGSRAEADAVQRQAESRALERTVGIKHRVDAVLAADGLDIALQPLISVSTGTWIGAEALSRFPDNRPPNVWFAEAHEVGLGVELELLAVHRAVEVVYAVPGTVALSFNASPALILDRRFAEALDGPAVPLNRLVVEITEHEVVDRYDDLMAALRPLRDRGLRVSVDDTGAGYSSLRHVLRIRPDNIKLDRSFVAEVASDPATRAMVTAIVLAAMEMGASVTAEGVEDADGLRALDLLGVDSAQGYLLARPTTDPWEWNRWRTRNWGSVLADHDQATATAE